MEKLNLGCGRNIKRDYTNLDFFKLDGVDVVHNLNKYPYPFKDNTFTEIYCNGVIEELDDFVKTMKELYRISKNKCKITVISPCFSNQISAQHPYTKKFMVWESFAYFGDSKCYLTKGISIKTNKREYIYSYKWYAKPINFLINLAPITYNKLFINILPAQYIKYDLEVVKKIPILDELYPEKEWEGESC